MKTGICYVVGAGENYGLDFVPSENDYVIAADAGLLYLEERGIRTDLVIGDFDSLNHIPSHKNTTVLNAQKDETDLFAAIQEGIKAGYRTFYIYCGTGRRIDHTMANIQTLTYLSQNGMQGFLFGKNTVITAITNREVCFHPIASGYISVFSHTEKAKGVYLRGLKYELNDAILTNTFPLGVSNEFIGKESSITVEEGTLLLVYNPSIISQIAAL